MLQQNKSIVRSDCSSQFQIYLLVLLYSICRKTIFSSVFQLPLLAVKINQILHPQQCSTSKTDKITATNQINRLSYYPFTKKKKGKHICFLKKSLKSSNFMFCSSKIPECKKWYSWNTKEHVPL